MGEAPLSMNESPLEFCQRHDVETERGDLQFKPVSNNHTENIQRELNGDKLASTSMRNTFSCPNGNDGIEYACSESIDQTS